METKNAPQITIVSGACCSPNLVKLDQILEKNLQQALDELGMTAETRKVSLSAILNGGGDLTEKEKGQISALFQGYGARFTPAVLIGEEVRFAGKPPTTDQIKELLKVVLAPNA